MVARLWPPGRASEQPRGSAELAAPCVSDVAAGWVAAAIAVPAIDGRPLGAAIRAGTASRPIDGPDHRPQPPIHGHSPRMQGRPCGKSRQALLARGGSTTTAPGLELTPEGAEPGVILVAPPATTPEPVQAPQQQCRRVLRHGPGCLVVADIETVVGNGTVSAHQMIPWT